jgi:hypothetical protein
MLLYRIGTSVKRLRVPDYSYGIVTYSSYINATAVESITELWRTTTRTFRSPNILRFVPFLLKQEDIYQNRLTSLSISTIVAAARIEQVI